SFLDEIRARLPVSQVVSRRVALKRAGREYKGLSPFKDEKTPSFTVNDQKAFYHCFATGEHGDIFRFLMATEGVSFPEAVEQLAGEAGVPMPVARVETPEDRAVRDSRDRLYALMEAAQAFFLASLRGTGGRDAADYLDRRQIAPEIAAHFGLGYAPGSRNALKTFLADKGFSEDDAILAGMLIGGPDIDRSYDRFRHRVTFPITDLKGRVIAFGGRALDPSAPAKYLNSPETPLFHKGHVLYNAASARQAAYERGEIIVVEGYMDVIALAHADRPNAVAPLGTALTEAQLGQIWRMADEPILSFDGDGAGRKAAHRALETALPGIGPGRSLRFAFMPEGQDPDDLLRAEGAGAVHAVLAQAAPLVDVLWEKEWGAGNWTTPERRAQLERSLRRQIDRIEDPAVRNHYQRAISDRLFNAWRRQRPTAAGRSTPGGRAQQGASRGGFGGDRRQGPTWTGRGSGRQGGAAAGQRNAGELSSGLLNSAIVRSSQAPGVSREALLLKTLIVHPGLIDDVIEEIAGIDFAADALAHVRDVLLGAHAAEKSLDTPTLHIHFDNLGCDPGIGLIERLTAHRSERFAEPDASLEEAAEGWRHTLELHNGKHLEDDVHRAAAELSEEFSDEAYARLIDVHTQIAGLTQKDLADRSR
ncbi:MAG: DNA primase, partial [Pseudomonadota bacterium]